MSDRLNAAQAALSAGRRDEAIEHLIAAIAEDPARTVQVYRALVLQLYNAGRFAEGEAFSARGLERHPRDYDLLNTRGVLLRKLKRQPEAVGVFEAAIKLNPKGPAAQQNLGNVLLDLGEFAKAEALYTKLLRLDPRNSEYHRQMGRALSRQGKIEPALMRLRQAVSFKRENVDAWLDMIGLFNEEFRHKEAEEAIDKALAIAPGNMRLAESKALVMRRAGQSARSEAFLEEQLPAHPDSPWIHYQLGMLVADRDRERANHHLEKAYQLDPGKLEHATALDLPCRLPRARGSRDRGAVAERQRQRPLARDGHAPHAEPDEREAGSEALGLARIDVTRGAAWQL